MAARASRSIRPATARLSSRSSAVKASTSCRLATSHASIPVSPVKHKACWPAILILLCAGTAHGQIPPEPDPSSIRVRIGPLWLNPTLSLTNAGIDTNVFNDSEADQPKRDFTLTVTPQTDLWLRMGRTWVMGNIKEDIVWYNTYASERSANTGYALNWLVPLTRVLVRRRRQRYLTPMNGRASKSTCEPIARSKASMARSRFARCRGRCSALEVKSGNSISPRAVFLGINLRDELNRTVTAASVTMRHELTPLTSLMVDVGRQQERFDFLDAPRHRFNAGQRRVALRPVRADQWIRAGRLPRLRAAVVRSSPLLRQHRVGELVVRRARSDAGLASSSAATSSTRSTSTSPTTCRQASLPRSGNRFTDRSTCRGALAISAWLTAIALARSLSSIVRTRSDPTAAALATGWAGICASGSTSISRGGNL